MPTQITLRSLTKSYDGRRVLDGVTCSLPAGQRTGVIGENGSGKSTLLRLLAGRERPDDGEVLVHADGGVGYLAQQPAPPSRHATVQAVLDDALRELRALESRLRHLEQAMAAGAESDLTEYGRLLTVFELRGGYDADARAERALHGLGLGGLRRDRPAGSLSGGEQARLHLASVLAANPEVLLLDEPTNHLDDTALTWLEDHLRTRRGTTVAVSHDRVFLERVASILVEVDADRRALARYGTGYAGYLTEKAARRQRWVQAYQRWRDEVAKLRQAAATTARQVAPNRARTDGNKLAYDRHAGRVQQSVASRVRNTEQRLRRLLDDPVPPPPEPLRFTPPPAVGNATTRGTVLEAVDAGVVGRLRASTLTVTTGDRLLISGPNGAGKTTLLQLLVGELDPDTGQVTRRGRIAYLPQEVAAAEPGQTVLAAFAAGLAGHPDEHAEALLAFGLFTPEQLTAPVGTLSAGGRRRLELARLLREPADVLLLDEPTNHLSLDLVEDMEAAWADHPAAVVVVSHDRRLRQRWRGQHLRMSRRDTHTTAGHAPATARRRTP